MNDVSGFEINNVCCLTSASDHGGSLDSSLRTESTVEVNSNSFELLSKYTCSESVNIEANAVGNVK